MRPIRSRVDEQSMLGVDYRDKNARA